MTVASTLAKARPVVTSGEPRAGRTVVGNGPPPTITRTKVGGAGEGLPGEAELQKLVFGDATKASKSVLAQTASFFEDVTTAGKRRRVTD
ncbi:MAG: hypothetical protein ACT4TC_22920 [Myxococcaceae bacterium]